jgi:hypothetical protein
MHERDQEGQHAEMAAVVEQRQETAVEPRQRPDAEDDGQHDEGAAAESADAQVDGGQQILGRIEPMDQHQVATNVERHAAEQDGVVDELRPVPLHGAKTGAHGLVSCVVGGVGGSGGGRSTSAIAKATMTAKASTGQSAR